MFFGGGGVTETTPPNPLPHPVRSCWEWYPGGERADTDLWRHRVASIENANGLIVTFNLHRIPNTLFLG